MIEWEDLTARANTGVQTHICKEVPAHNTKAHTPAFMLLLR